jgi:hypothetical protein
VCVSHTNVLSVSAQKGHASLDACLLGFFIFVAGKPTQSVRQPNRRAGAKPIACACLRFFQICSVPIARVLEVNRTCGEGLTPYPAASSVRCEQMLLDVSRDRDAQVLGWVRGQQAKAPLTGDHPTTNRDPTPPSNFPLSLRLEAGR